MTLKTLFLATAPLLLFLLNPTLHSAPPDPYKTWRDYGGSSDQSKFTTLEQFSKDNLDQLEIQWTYKTGDLRSYQFNPLIIEDTLYVLGKNSSLIAVDFNTGNEKWIHANLRGITRRGISFWQSADGTQRRLLFMINNTLQSIDADTGQSDLNFGNEGVVDLREQLGRDPLTITRAMSHTPGRVYKNLIIVGSSTGESYGSSPGYIRAYNVLTGEHTWTFHTIPLPGEFGYETWPEDAWKYMGGVNCWGEISLDDETGIAYIPLGSPTYDFYGADRIGSNLFGNCLLALDASTGKRIWHFQTVHHDLWDYDLTSAPQLLTIKKDGKSIKVVSVAVKQGYLYVLDRLTGEPVYPIEEVPVRASEMPGEQAWPTQPIPTTLEPFSRQRMTENDITPFFLTDEERSEWTERVRKARKGHFLPPSMEESVTVPGAVGGVNWGNTAANPEKGIMYLLNQDFPSFYKLKLREPEVKGRPGSAEHTQGSIERGKTLFQTHCQICHGPDLRGTAAAPSLRPLLSNLSYYHLSRTLRYGMGRMPPLQHIARESINDVFSFLKQAKFYTSDISTLAKSDLPEGPVVASGGASTESLQPSNRNGNPYPAGDHAPTSRYFTEYGLGHPYIISPPWSTIIAYDLNEGKIKWRKPLGQDKIAAEEGGINTGVPRGSQRNGMIITQNGLVFSTAKDGHIYCFDADNGDTLWKLELPMGTEGLPTMAEVNGKQYLIVCATTPLTWGMNSRESGVGSTYPKGVGGYVVIGLPE